MILICEECHNFKIDVAWSQLLQIFVCDECFTEINDELEQANIDACSEE